jgi:6-hydroxytryprostatin B O-methyltransferase
MISPAEEDLERLAEICLSTAKQIKEHLSSKRQPQPTFDQSGPSTFPPIPPELQQVRLDLRTAAKRLYDLASGPEDVVTWHLYQSVSPLAQRR